MGHHVNGLEMEKKNGISIEENLEPPQSKSFFVQSQLHNIAEIFIQLK